VIAGQQTGPQQPEITTGSTPVALRAFPAASSLGAEPPDTQVAVGPNYVGEAVNETLTVWTRGGALAGGADLNGFFSIPTGAGYFFSDPRIVYDNAPGRWFLSGMAVNPALADSNIYLAVSANADPTGSWLIYQLASGTGVIGDQPKIGVSDDKLVISWNDFNSSNIFQGQQTWVLQKSDLLNGVTVRETQFALDSTRFDIVPATSLSATSTEYLTYNNTCSNSTGFGTGSCTAVTPTLGVVAITGTPATGNVVWNEYDPPATQTSNPPPGAQTTGPMIATGDDRLLTAVWQNGELWTSANDTCLVQAISHACLRLTEITTNPSPGVILEADIGQTGDDLYYPAVTVDGAGDPYVVATISSRTIAPSLVAFGRSASTGPFVGVSLWLGQGSYAGSRWGDYSGAAPDPADPSDVWVGGEYVTPGGNPNWGTAIGQLTFSGPTLTGVSPSSGPTAGGTHVTVRGTNLSSNATVRFGATPAASVTVTSSTQLVATAPAENAGPVDITVTTPGGTTATSPADLYTFVAPFFTLRPGLGVDVGVGADGSVWVVGTNPVPGGYGIYRWTGSTWATVPGGAVRIAVDPSGNSWVVNSAGNIFHWAGNNWSLYPGLARDVGVGADGSVWVVGTNPVPGGYGVWRLTLLGWSSVPGGGVAISVGPSGNPWIVDSAGKIYSS
jgi:hypothetical protein